MNVHTFLWLLLLGYSLVATGQQQIEQDALSARQGPIASDQQFELVPAQVTDLTGKKDLRFAIEVILKNLPVSTAQANSQQTPIDSVNGIVYTANIEPGPDGDVDGINLHTVVRRGEQNENGTWQWDSTVVEDRTLHDKWHTAPSIGIDKEGYIHVVYNMHNLPWQYKVSVFPDDLEKFEFRGQKITTEELERLHYDNKVSFTSLGKADIPGNLITYPAFFKDSNGDLYLTYRFAAKPKRRHSERAFSSGIAKYNIQEREWKSIGSELDVSLKDRSWSFSAPLNAVPFASAPGWTAYRPYLLFDSENRMHVIWYWRQGISGSLVTRPCYLISDDQVHFHSVIGLRYRLPVDAESCGNTALANETEYYSIGNSAINSKGDVYLLHSPHGSKRVLQHFRKIDYRWEIEESPFGATEIFIDSQDNLWAVANGLRILRRGANENIWKLIYTNESIDDCLPRVSQNYDKTVAYIHTQRCKTEDFVSIYQINTID